MMTRDNCNAARAIATAACHIAADIEIAAIRASMPADKFRLAHVIDIGRRRCDAMAQIRIDHQRAMRVAKF